MANRSPALVLVHAVWATEKRRATLDVTFDSVLVDILGSKARDLGCALLAAGCAADHVHAVVRLTPATSLGELIGRMKGGSTYDANRHVQVPAQISWQSGYWAESLGPSDLDGIVRYVRSQRIHHDWSHPAERWQFKDP